MKQIITKCICDVCKEEYEENELEKITVPMRVWDCEGRSSFKGFTKNVDMCERCKERYFDVVWDNFAQIEDVHGKIVVR